jgi:uncharacterized protein DUF6788
MNIENLSLKKKSILKQIAGIGQLRKGNVTFQMVETKNKKGKVVKRGPYPLYSYKNKSKTISKRLRMSQVEEYQKQIDEFQNFKRLTTELVEINQQMSDILILENEDEKKHKIIH